jgi:hypothetical protein
MSPPRRASPGPHTLPPLSSAFHQRLARELGEMLAAEFRPKLRPDAPEPQNAQFKAAPRHTTSRAPRKEATQTKRRPMSKPSGVENNITALRGEYTSPSL